MFLLLGLLCFIKSPSISEKHFRPVAFVSVSEPQVPLGEGKSSSDVLLWGLSHHDPTGTLRTFSEDEDPIASLNLNIPEAIVSQLVRETLMPRDCTVKDRKEGMPRTGDPPAHLPRHGSAAGEPRAALSCLNTESKYNQAER